MNPTLLSNRIFSLPGDGWSHVVPLGEFSHPSGVVQVIDGIAAEKMVADFKNRAAEKNFPGLLVDFDHFSDDQDKPSAAAGWIEDLANRADGVWAKIKWSRKGREAVEGGDYRLVSPVFPWKPVEEVSATTPAAMNRNKGRRIRPLRLLKVALTNDPNLKGMVPLSNRGASSDAADNNNKNQRQTMKSVCVLLGLSADASEEAVHGEVLKLKNRGDITVIDLEALRNRATQLEATNKELLGAQIEADLEKYKNRFKPEAKETVKAQLLANRKATIELLESMPEGQSGTRGSSSGQYLHNRGGGNGRSVSENMGADRGEDRKRADEIHSATEEYRLQNRCSYETALEAVRRKKPELFTAQS
jgi:phage I-like protein